jgi:hypothetical protein
MKINKIFTLFILQIFEVLQKKSVFGQSAFEVQVKTVKLFIEFVFDNAVASIIEIKCFKINRNQVKTKK